MADSDKPKWDDLTRKASRIIGAERTTEIVGRSADRTELLEASRTRALAAVLASSERQRTRFEFQMRRSERLAVIGQMAAGLVHEVNNPLGALSGFIQLMISEYPELAKGLQMLDEMSGEVRRIRGTLDRLLDFSRHSVGAMEARRREIDLGRLVAEPVELVEPQIHFSRIRASSEIAGDLAPIVGNADELKQVFMNIMLNAVQAMPTGGELEVKVANDTASAEDVPPQPAPRRAGDPPETSFYHLRRADGSTEAAPVWSPGDPVVRVTIADTGVGIKPEQVELIFEPFFTTKGRGEGTGLGLSTSLGIVNSHGGDIRIESTPGEGSTFAVTLPASRKPGGEAKGGEGGGKEEPR